MGQGGCCAAGRRDMMIFVDWVIFGVGILEWTLCVAGCIAAVSKGWGVLVYERPS